MVTVYFCGNVLFYRLDQLIPSYLCLPMKNDAVNNDATKDTERNPNAFDDFDFEFDEDFEPETASEYLVMDAMRFDRDAGTASCDFEIDEIDSPTE